MCIKSFNISTGISDCHDFMSTVVHSNIPKDEILNLNFRVLEHAPIKQAYQRRMKLSCMNSNLKKQSF